MEWNGLDWIGIEMALRLISRWLERVAKRGGDIRMECAAGDMIQKHKDTNGNTKI